MTRQLSLFDQPARSITTSDKTVCAVEAKRLNAQSRKILARLKEGPVTNVELATIAKLYTARNADLRSAGCIITCFDRNRKTGVNKFRLDFCPEGLA